MSGTVITHNLICRIKGLEIKVLPELVEVINYFRHISKRQELIDNSVTQIITPKIRYYNSSI